MIIPSIDLMQGDAVQLRGGKERVLNAGDPRPLATRFGRVGEIAVVDLDAALGTGDNVQTIDGLLSRARCRVGGGIRDAHTALEWLDRGATQVVIGTAATRELLSQLPRERVVVALDARDGEVVVNGWTRGTGRGVLECMAELRDLVGGFLVTVVENEGRMTGLDPAYARQLADAAGSARVTLAGGVRTPQEIAALDAMDVDVQVGMALYTGAFDLTDALVAHLNSDRPDGLWPTVVTDERGVALGLAWSSAESLRRALDDGRGVYHSRSRGLWVKGETSGATQDLLRVDLDCDRDALRFIVRQQGTGFCHLGTESCWGEGSVLRSVEQVLASRARTAVPGSYTARLLDDPKLLDAKLREEAHELATACGADRVAEEAADLLYFALVALARSQVSWSAVEAQLARRLLKTKRRGGAAKPEWVR